MLESRESLSFNLLSKPWWMLKERPESDNTDIVRHRSYRTRGANKMHSPSCDKGDTAGLILTSHRSVKVAFDKLMNGEHFCR